MQPHRAPRPRDDKTARAHLRANVQAAAAAADDQHPGHWELHHITLPGDRPGDFTPVGAPQYAEDATSLHGDLLRYLAEVMFGLGAAQCTAEHQAGAEPEAEAG